jgi:hypothetical protein
MISNEQFIYTASEFLTVVSMKRTIFWDITLCSAVEFHRRFGLFIVCYLLGLYFHLEDGISMFLRNVLTPKGLDGITSMKTVFFSSFTVKRSLILSLWKHLDNENIAVIKRQVAPVLLLIQSQQLRLTNYPSHISACVMLTRKEERLTLMHVLRLTAAELGNEVKSWVLPQTEFHVPFFQSMEVLAIRLLVCTAMELRSEMQKYSNRSLAGSTW